jgi:hypothetical protein
MALLALIGTILMTVLLVWIFVSSVIYVLRDVEAPVALRLIPPCVWLLQSGGVLFRVPPSAAVVVIWARRAAVLGSSQYLFYPFAGIRLPGGMGSGGRLSRPMVSRGCGVYWPVSWAIWA